ncbi:hypothetical protein TUN205_06798 [Pyrenophora tritici-repentis]|nr:hypothetical protein TUN205_06798 [Pyrenophora tritici-repentis]
MDLVGHLTGSECIAQDHTCTVEINLATHYPGAVKSEYLKSKKCLYPLFNIKHLESLQVVLVVNYGMPWCSTRCALRYEEVLAPVVFRLSSLGAQVSWYRRCDNWKMLEKIGVPSRSTMQTLEELQEDIAAHSLFNETTGGD